MKSYRQFISESVNIAGDFTGNLYVNLPFVSANRSDNRIPGSIRSTIAFTGNVMIVPYNYENTNEVYFSAMTAAGGITAFLSVSAVSPGGAAQICLTYTVYLSASDDADGLLKRSNTNGNH